MLIFLEFSYLGLAELIIFFYFMLGSGKSFLQQSKADGKISQNLLYSSEHNFNQIIMSDGELD